jgi:hypothetical protein
MGKLDIKNDVAMPVSQIIRWIIAVPLGLFGWWVIGLNFALVYRWFTRGKHSSMAPFIGGIAGLFGMMICPLPTVQKWAWVPLVVDLGWFTLCCLAGFAGMIFFPGKGGERASDKSDTTADEGG